MTPTPEQLADVLPRCAAGLDGGNWTKADARLAWATKVLAWVEEATKPCSVNAAVNSGSPDTALDRPRSDATGPDVSRKPGNVTGPRSAHVVLDGDTWEVRDGLATIVGSNDWSSPPTGAILTQPSPPAPGITYHDAEEAR